MKLAHMNLTPKMRTQLKEVLGPAQKALDEGGPNFMIIGQIKLDDDFDDQKPGLTVVMLTGENARDAYDELRAAIATEAWKTSTQNNTANE